MRTLDLLVPQYKETDEIAKLLLDSIAIQQNVDFNEIGVIIVNDGTDVYLTDKLLTSYPFKIEYYKEEHRGVSGTRNSCLDHSTAKYIMYCDCDDLFFNACGLWMIFNEIEQGFDVLTSKFVEETYVTETKKPFYINRENDSTFVHGKVLRRNFLVNNNIRWNEALTIHEDSYFNCLTQILAQKNQGGFKYYSTAFYLWKWRQDSVCRKDPLYLNKTYVNMYDSNQALVKECLDRRLIDDAANLVISMVYESYYAFNTERWQGKTGIEYLPKTEKRFSLYWKELGFLFKNSSKDQKIKLASGIRTKYFNQGLLDVKFSFEEWIKHIEELIE